jgi:hypothetical protein
MVTSISRRLSFTKAGAICCGCLLALPIAVVIYNNAASTARPDNLHTHRHEFKRAVRYFTDEQEWINSAMNWSLSASFIAFAGFNVLYSRIRAREQGRALEAQLAIDDQHPENIR